MIDWPKVVQDLEKENARLRKTQDALVAAAYRAAAEVVNEVIPHNKYDDQTYEYVAAVKKKKKKKLTPADAEKALREFGMEVAEKTAMAYWPTPAKNNIEQIVDEVMKK